MGDFQPVGSRSAEIPGGDGGNGQDTRRRPERAGGEAARGDAGESVAGAAHQMFFHINAIEHMIAF